MAMDVGIHLPQFGPASGPNAISAAAVRAEELGFAGVWVSDHIVQPADQGYPSPYLYDPLLTLAWAAAATTSIGLGTSVLVARASGRSGRTDRVGRVVQGQCIAREVS